MYNFFSPTNLFIVLTFLVIWLSTITVFLIKSQKQYLSLTKGISKKDLKTILLSLKKDHQLNSKQLKVLKNTLSATQNQTSFHIHRVGFVRYNPFSDTGGDQSFCLSLLDGHNNGIVISSLHSRNQTRIYAKKIKNGKSRGYTLSKEERAVIKSAAGLNS